MGRLPVRAVLAKVSQMLMHSKVLQHFTSGISSPLTMEAGTIVLGKSVLASFTVDDRKSGPARSTTLPQYAFPHPSLEVHPVRAIMTPLDEGVGHPLCM